jgi:ribosomal protein L11 methyltransferase
MCGRIFTSFTIGPFAIIPEGASATGIGVPIILGRKGAFGSGEHETTAACLEELARLPRLADAILLDLGSGTGILSIAAARLGAAHTVALDIDPQAVASCMENVLLNGLEGKVVTVCGELASLADAAFDILLANIYADIHLSLAQDMVRLVLPGGHLILSGIPLQDKYDVWRRFTALGCDTVTSRIGEDYATYVMRRGKSTSSRDGG